MKSPGAYIKALLCAGVMAVSAIVAHGQDESPLVKKRLSLTLDDVIELAREQSQAALVAKHTFTVKYWQYRTYKAQFLPSLNLSAQLGQFNRSLRALQDAETGDFVITGLAKVDWTTVAVVTAIGIVLGVVLTAFARREKKM